MWWNSHVLRTVLTPEPEKVNPLVLPGQQGDGLLGLPTVWWPSYNFNLLVWCFTMSHVMPIVILAEAVDKLDALWNNFFFDQVSVQVKWNLSEVLMEMMSSLYRPSLILIWLIGTPLIYMLIVGLSAKVVLYSWAAVPSHWIVFHYLPTSQVTSSSLFQRNMSLLGLSAYAWRYWSCPGWGLYLLYWCWTTKLKWWLKITAPVWCLVTDRYPSDRL